MKKKPSKRSRYNASSIYQQYREDSKFERLADGWCRASVFFVKKKRTMSGPIADHTEIGLWLVKISRDGSA